MMTHKAKENDKEKQKSSHKNSHFTKTKFKVTTLDEMRGKVKTGEEQNKRETWGTTSETEANTHTLK